MIPAMDDSELLTHLTALARELWDRELREPTATGLDSYGARAELERFVERVRKGAFSTHDVRDEATLIAVVRLIERALDVDMNRTANRKGGVPAALGLVDRASLSNSVRDRLIYRLVDEARYNTGVAGRSIENCFALVAQALAEAGIERDRGLKSVDNVKKVYQRVDAKPHDKAPPIL